MTKKKNKKTFSVLIVCILLFVVALAGDIYVTPSIAQDKSVSLREYFERILVERDNVLEQRYRDQQTAIQTALTAMDKRLDGMNEFRATLQDQSAKQLTKAEFQMFKDKVDEDIRILRESKAELSGMATQASVNDAYFRANISLIISIVGSLVAVIMGIGNWLLKIRGISKTVSGL
jgi:hypothetical protein